MKEVKVIDNRALAGQAPMRSRARSGSHGSNEPAEAVRAELDKPEQRAVTKHTKHQKSEPEAQVL